MNEVVTLPYAQSNLFKLQCYFHNRARLNFYLADAYMPTCLQWRTGAYMVSGACHYYLRQKNMRT